MPRAVHSQVHGRQMMSLLCHVASQGIQELLRAFLKKNAVARKESIICVTVKKKNMPLRSPFGLPRDAKRRSLGIDFILMMDSYNHNST